MIHYHGGPITPNSAAVACWTGRHAFVSFEHPYQLSIAAEVCQSFALDNGAFSAWKQGRVQNWAGYYEWCAGWLRHPGCDWAIIPDVIEGTEQENDEQIEKWPLGKDQGVPVWHLHESLERLSALSLSWPRVALGSSGEFAAVDSSRWCARMEQAMRAACDGAGRPSCKLHGLRMLDPAVVARFPFASADSTNVARNVGMDSRWRSVYADSSKDVRALVLAQRIEAVQSPPIYEFSRQSELLERSAA